MGYQAAPHASLGLLCGLYQFVPQIEGTAQIPDVTVLCHKRSTVHSIFQISISPNTICAEMVDFCKPGHI